MTPALIAQLPAFIGLLITAAPEVAKGIENAKQLIQALFSKGLISAEVQDALNLYVDAEAAMVKSGVRPSHWTVQPDPV